MYNILTEPIIHYAAASGTQVPGSLPEIYVALLVDKVTSFPALRPHQRHAWHAFLVQLGAMAMHREGVDTPPESAEEWAQLIRGLTPDHPEDEPWQLVVDDITKPAFMQPPASSKDREKDYKATVFTPDELDMLVTSKNHDLKAAVAAQAAVDDWIFALVTLQTMEGFGGAGNYGISRMNGGLGSRPAFTLTLSTRPGPHIRRDIEALLECRPSLLENYPMTDNGVGLLWVNPWDGTGAEALTPNLLEPFYIEVCRRIRLSSDEDVQLFGIRASSKSSRIEAKAMNGQMGDPWTPIDRKGNKSLTLGSGGFNYRRVTNYLNSEDWELPALFKPTSPEEHFLVARAMIRGQGKTEGYHERIIPLRPKLIRTIMGRNSGEIQQLGDVAKERVDNIGKVKIILRHAIATFAARGEGDNTSPDQRALANPWSDRLDEIMDTRFFEDLQDEFDADDASERQSIRNDWLLYTVIKNARDVLRDAEDSLPCPAIYSYRARVAAEGLFEGRIRGRNGFPDLFINNGGN